jgi:MORN repeat
MRFYLPFVALTLAMPVFAQSPTRSPSSAPDAERPSGPTTGWLADAKTGCKIWEGAPDPDEKISWSGECADGMAEGKGILQFFIGNDPAARYEGDLRNGRADGQGIRIDPDGTRYEGLWRNNAAEGFGVYTKGGKRYEGTWTNGCLKLGADELAVGVTRESCGFK